MIKYLFPFFFCCISSVAISDAQGGTPPRHEAAEQAERQDATPGERRSGARSSRLEQLKGRAPAQVAHTLERVSRDIPANARFSAAGDDVPAGRLLEDWSKRKLKERAGDLPKQLRNAKSFEDRKALIRQFREDNQAWLEAHHQEVQNARRFLREQDPEVSRTPTAEAREARRALMERLKELPARERATALRMHREEQRLRISSAKEAVLDTSLGGEASTVVSPEQEALAQPATPPNDG